MSAYKGSNFRSRKVSSILGNPFISKVPLTPPIPSTSASKSRAFIFPKVPYILVVSASVISYSFSCGIK